MTLKNINNKLNKNVNEETELIDSLSLGKYLLIYIPILFLMFALGQLIADIFFDIPFDIRYVIIQAISFALFLRIFHKLRLKIQRNWKNKHN